MCCDYRSSRKNKRSISDQECDSSHDKKRRKKLQKTTIHGQHKQGCSKQGNERDMRYTVLTRLQKEFPPEKWIVMCRKCGLLILPRAQAWCCDQCHTPLMCNKKSGGCLLSVTTHNNNVEKNRRLKRRNKKTKKKPKKKKVLEISDESSTDDRSSTDNRSSGTNNSSSNTDEESDVHTSEEELKIQQSHRKSRESYNIDSVHSANTNTSTNTKRNTHNQQMSDQEMADKEEEEDEEEEEEEEE